MEYIKKAPTGIEGLDEITRGGFPLNRPTLVCGGPGCGKTILAMEFLVHGAREFAEPGLFLSFEEIPGNLIDNLGSFGWSLQDLIHKKQLNISHVDLSHEEIVETGTFTLEGLLIRLAHGISQIGAKRVAIDTLDNLFTAIPNSETLRKEVGRLFHWLMEKGVSTVITGESGKGELTRNGFEEYVSDCVIKLDHRVDEQITKRRLRIVKYRGTGHDKDEYPFMIGSKGFCVIPITGVTLDYPVVTEKMSSGIKDLDAMLGGNGVYRRSSIAITGKSGTGKSSLVAAFASESCRRGERALYLAFEESPDQITRNMLSVGIDFRPWLENGLLQIEAFRPSLLGLEEHILTIISMVDDFKPDCVVMDPITDFISVGNKREVKSMFTRILDQFKNRNITIFLSALTRGPGSAEETAADMSSLMDTWISLDLKRIGNTNRREIHIIKSRGMAHSLDVCELIMSSDGLSIVDIFDKEQNPVTASNEIKG